MDLEESKSFVRRHFDDFVNGKDLGAADRNFAAEYIEHGVDAPPGSAPGPAGPKHYLSMAFKRFPDLTVTIEDMIAEGDKVVVRNTWRGTDSQTGKRVQFGGIVIWRIAGGKLAERWAYLEPPTAVT